MKLKDYIRILKNIPFVESIWQKIRERKILRRHDQLAQFWRRMIDLYFADKIERYEMVAKKDLQQEKVIWQYWGQGVENADLPEPVAICFASVDRYKGDYQVIRLTDETISDYIDLPDFVLERIKNPAFTRVFFSDLLRLALLKVYGGVWLDATILLTQTLPQSLAESAYFAFQRDDQAQDKAYWMQSYAYYWSWAPAFRVNLLSSIIFAKKDTLMISVLTDLMLHYWKTQDTIIDYFFFQMLYDELVRNELAESRCAIVDDTLPHLLQTKINGGFPQLSYQAIFERQGIHKLTYFAPDAVHRLKEVLRSQA